MMCVGAPPCEEPESPDLPFDIEAAGWVSLAEAHKFIADTVEPTMLVQGCEAKIIDVNQSWLAICGFCRDDVVDQSFSLIQGPKTFEGKSGREMKKLLEACGRRQAETATLVNYTKDKHEMLNSIRAIPCGIDAYLVVSNISVDVCTECAHAKAEKFLKRFRSHSMNSSAAAPTLSFSSYDLRRPSKELEITARTSAYLNDLFTHALTVGRPCNANVELSESIVEPKSPMVPSSEILENEYLGAYFRGTPEKM